MKRFLMGFLVLMVTLTAIAPTQIFASTSLPRDEFGNKEMMSVDEIRSKKMIAAIEPYVAVSDEGKLYLKDVPRHLYEMYNLEELEQHFADLNHYAENDYITINKDLTIDQNPELITPDAVYGKWTYHWWGYDRKFNNSQAKAFADYAASVAGGAGIVTGIGAFFPPVAAIAGVQTGYWSLVAARVNANNKGRGVYIAVTWVAIFNVEPL